MYSYKEQIEYFIILFVMSAQYMATARGMS